MSEDDLILLENYANGVNKLVESSTHLPFEFQLTMTSFEAYTPLDCVISNLFVTSIL